MPDRRARLGPARGTRRSPRERREPIRRIPVPLLLFFALATPAFGGAPAGSGNGTDPSTAPLELVLQGGRVLDPASGLDAVRDVGVRDGRIVAVSETPLAGARVLDVHGLVVAPGFIDLHTHSPTRVGQRYQLQDGVTTALELEAGAFPVDELAPELAGHARIHYGASAGFGSIRTEAMLGIRQAHLISSKPRPIGPRGYWTALRSLFVAPRPVFSTSTTPAERRRMRRLFERALDDGALGIGLPLDYFSEGVDADELRMVFEIAGERAVPVFVHVRRGVNGDPAGLREVLALARATGAPLHVCHLQHNAMRNTELFLREIREARAQGADVTTEVLPYNAGSAVIASAVFGRDWRTIFAIDYADVEWVETGERFDEAMWNDYRERFPLGQVAHHYVKEEWTRRALAEPGVMVVSDLLPMRDEQSRVAPHNGAFARVLGRYVREAGVLELPTAIAKMTWLPARRLEVAFPRFARKGRIAVGADADLTVFDPETVLDRATYADPFQPSAGIEHVVVAGRLALEHGAPVDDVYAGERLQHDAGLH
ncbi:MAG: amidohydrolase family protein [Myxococcales bacterium]|nr:amidohydrolase family protein [Myxococcales bacterium]